MWQRIQTVFLAIAVISLVLTIFMPIWVLEEATKVHKLYPMYYGIFENGQATTSTYYPYVITAMLAAAAATVAIIQIRKFKDRNLQIKLGAFNSILMAGTIGAAVVFATGLYNEHHGGHYGFGMYLPGVAVICNWLAMRFIRKDEKLVRDSDRLR